MDEELKDIPEKFLVTVTRIPSLSKLQHEIDMCEISFKAAKSY